MIRLLKIEFTKIFNYSVFWILFGLYLVGFIGFAIILGFIKIEGGLTIDAMSLGFYKFPQVYHSVAYISGFFMLLLAVVMLVIATNEYQYRTLRQGVINGMSKAEFLLGKLMLILLFSIVSTIFCYLLSLALGFVFTPVIEDGMLGENLHYLLAYFVQIFAFLMFGFTIGLLVKRTGIAIVVLAVYYIIIEPLITAYLTFSGSTIGQFFPAQSIKTLIEFPLSDFIGMEDGGFGATPGAIAVTAAWSCIYVGASYLLLVKRDI